MFNLKIIVDEIIILQKIICREYKYDNVKKIKKSILDKFPDIFYFLCNKNLVLTKDFFNILKHIDNIIKEIQKSKLINESNKYVMLNIFITKEIDSYIPLQNKLWNKYRYAYIFLQNCYDNNLNVIKTIKNITKLIKYIIKNKTFVEIIKDVKKYKNKILLEWNTKKNKIIKIIEDITKIKLNGKYTMIADEMTCAYAAKNGKFKTLKWLRKKECPWDHYTCSFAAGNGYIDILKWARENGCFYKYSIALQLNIYKNCKINKYFINKIFIDLNPWGAITCAFAADGKYFDILKWLRENGCDWDRWTCSNAAKNNDFEILKWAIENGCFYKYSIALQLNIYKNCKINKYFINKIFIDLNPCDEKTCAYAAGNGNFDMLKWAREHSCFYKYFINKIFIDLNPWNKFTCECATINGYLDILKWAMENNCPWDDDVYTNALENNRINILEWLDENKHFFINTKI